MGHASDRMPEDDGEIFALKPEEPDAPPTRVPRMVPREPAAEPPPVAPAPAPQLHIATRPVLQAATPSKAILYERVKVARQGEDDPFPDKIVDFQMPIWLIAGGTLIEISAAFIRAGGVTPRLRVQLMAAGLQLIAGTFVMLVGLLIAARIRQIDLGRLPVAVLKLAAVAIAPGAAVTFMSPFLGLIPFVGGIAGFILQFVLYFALLGALFKMDESDTWYCVCVIFVVSIGVYFGIIAVIASL
jgi:hypothetical protein